MNEVFTLIRLARIWIYVLFGLLLVFSLRSVLRRIVEYRKAIFVLEREKAVKRLTTVSILFAVSLLILGGTYLATTFSKPIIRTESTSTPAPTLAFLAVPTDEGNLDAQSAEVRDDILLVGCNPETVFILSPEDGSELGGVEDISGTADIQNFAFYKYEYRTISDSAIWRSIFASTEPVVDGKLGTWDTGLVNPGEYLFRLVVTDTAGNAPYPCVIQVRIIAVED